MKALSNSNPAWYKAQTLANFMQMYGRSIRSEKDWAKTYILDQALIDFLRLNYRKIPRYISEAIHWR
jgi:Rad3-related DNA helicase